MPTSLLEAMVLGLPVIATPVGGVSELVEDGVTGVLVLPNDAGKLAEKIDQLLEAPEYRSAIGKCAKEYVLNNHSIRKMVEEHQKVFSYYMADAK